MAYEIPLFRLGQLRAHVDLSASEFCGLDITGVGSDGASELGLPSAGGTIHGINQGKPIAGEAVPLYADGISKAKIGAAVLNNAKLMVTSAGKFITATSGNYVVAVALEAGSADGDIIAVRLQNQGKV